MQLKHVEFSTSIICVMALLINGIAMADPVTGLNTFVPGQPATAASVNDNFTEVQNSVNDNDTRVTTNTGNIGTNTTNIGNNTTAIGTNATDIGINTTAIGTNAADILINAGDIGANSIAGDAREIRINTLEGLSGINNDPIPINCTTPNEDAFINTTIQDNTTYVLTGICNGPVQIVRKRNVIIQGDDLPSPTSKDDGVILPAGLITNPFAAIGIYEASVELRNLRVDASNYVTNNYSFGVATVNALNTGQQAITRVYDVDFLGGDIAISVFRNGYVKIYDNVTVTGFNLVGIEAFGNSHVEINQSIQVVGTTSNSTDIYPSAITASHNGFVQIKEGGTFTAPGGPEVIEPYSLSSYDSSSIQVRNSGTTTLNGWIGAGQSSSIRISGGAVLTGDIEAWDAGAIRFDNSSQSGGLIWAGRNSVIRIQSSSIDATGFGIGITQGSSLGLRDTTTVVSDTPLSLNSYSTMYINDRNGTPNLNSIGITCQSRNNQVLSGTNTTLGDLTNCPP